MFSFTKYGHSLAPMLIAYILLAVTLLSPVQGNKLNPFDDTPDPPDPPPSQPLDVAGGAGGGTTGGGTTGGGTTGGGTTGGGTTGGGTTGGGTTGGGTQPNVYSCPADNGALYVSNGIAFQLKCNQGTTATPLQRVPNVASQKDCADLCGVESLCQSCDWSINSNLCVLFGEYIPTIDYPGVSTWFPTAKRSQESGTTGGTPAPPADPNAIFCPRDENAIYTTPDGTYFAVKCQQHSSAANNANTASLTLKSLTTKNLEECMNACSETTGCLSVDYIARTGNHVVGTCSLFSTGDGFGPCSTNSVDTAYTIDPPEEEMGDESGVRCSTQCPFAEGQVYDSSYGERFHIDCGRRHGSTVLWSETQDSLGDCINRCAGIVPCHSVDYQESKKLCLLGKHHGEPSIQVAGWNSAHSLGCSGGCSSTACTAGG